MKTRVLVSPRRHEELVDRLVGLVESMPLGDPREPVTQIGPLVSARQRGIVEGYLGRGLSGECPRGGATAVVGGGRPDGVTGGWYVQPMVLTGVERSMRVAREEIFVPVLSVLRYADEDDAVALANDSSFGLDGAVFTSDLEHGLQVAARIRTGTVELNGSPSGQSAPTGGVKASGVGRENGPEGLDAFVEPKAIGLPPALAGTLT